VENLIASFNNYLSLAEFLYKNKLYIKPFSSNETQLLKRTADKRVILMGKVEKFGNFYQLTLFKESERKEI
jgi:hypothetical protein